MLLLSSDSDRKIDKTLYKSTRAIIFFGTPHRGSEFSDLGETLRRIASAVGFDTAKQNIRTLEIDSGILEECHRRFQQLQARQNIAIHTFQETQGVTGISYLSLNHKVNLSNSGTGVRATADILGFKIAPNFSSSFTGTESICSIGANHMTMCKFSSKEDVGYIRFTYALNDSLSRFDSTSLGKRIAIEQDKTEAR